jgi:hypothetical protein
LVVYEVNYSTIPEADIDVITDVDGAMSLEEHVLLSTVLEIESKDSLNYLGSLDELYLTKLAMVTMESTATKALSYYNSVNKRDIMETLGLDYNMNDIDNNMLKRDILNNVNGSLNVKNEEEQTSGPKVIYKRLKVVGRPKTYNIDELTNTSNEPTMGQQISKLIWTRL